MIKKLTIFIFLLLNLFTQAQEIPNGPEMADSFRSDGKIYVVIAVMATIFTCIVVYLVIIERKLRRLEQELKDKK